MKELKEITGTVTFVNVRRLNKPTKYNQWFAYTIQIDDGVCIDYMGWTPVPQLRKCDTLPSRFVDEVEVGSTVKLFVYQNGNFINLDFNKSHMVKL